MPEQSENKATNTDTTEKSKQPPATKPNQGDLSEEELKKVTGGGGSDDLRKAGGSGTTSGTTFLRFGG